MKWKLFWASLVTLSALLTACGGGGGGSSDPVQQQAQPDNSATLVIDARAVALGAKTAPVVVSGSMSGGTLTVDGKSITSDPKALLAGVTVDVAPGNVTAQVVDASGKSLATATTTVTCAKGVWDGTMCAPHKFDQLVLVGFAPFVGDQIGIGVLNLQTGKVTPLGNETGYTTKSTGAWQPVANCGLYLGMTEGNYPTASCEVMTQTGWKWMDFSIEPVRAVLLPYDPTIVAQGLYTGNVPWGAFGDSPYAKYGVSRIGDFTDVPGKGTYFISDSNKQELGWTADGFATRTVVNTGLAAGTQYNNIVTYVTSTNPN